MAGIPMREYKQYLSVIEAANDSKDKVALKEIQKQLIVKYGMDDRDVRYLLNKFKFTV